MQGWRRSSAAKRDRAGDGGPWYAVTVMAKPTLHLLALSSMPPRERVLALAKLLEQLRRKPTPEELAEAQAVMKTVR